MVRHDNDVWSSPLLVSLSYGSLEKRMDGETTSLIFVFENKKVLEELANGEKTVRGSLINTVNPKYKYALHLLSPIDSVSVVIE